MKYIRTKDGIRKVFRKLKDGFYLVRVSKYNYRHYYPDCKVADTIEELCDEFRGVWTNYYEEGKDAHEEYHYDNYDKEKKIFYDDFEELTPKEAIEKFDRFYGAIWTEKGLIYKARMKGVLPNGEIDWELL